LQGITAIYNNGKRENGVSASSNAQISQSTSTTPVAVNKLQT
jgi:hypothetical protein